MYFYIHLYLSFSFVSLIITFAVVSARHPYNNKPPFRFKIGKKKKKERENHVIIISSTPKARKTHYSYIYI